MNAGRIVSQASDWLRSRAQPDGPLQCAVIDIGSNSVRLVVYDIHGRAIIPRINEKVMAGLGRGLAETGRLNPEGVLAARGALVRFKALLDTLGVEQVQTIATAAVRDATDGVEFVKQVQDDVGMDIRVLTGQQEAMFAAKGVLAGSTVPDGVVGDLGGSSLELLVVDWGELQQGMTFPLGPLHLDRGYGFEEAYVRERVETYLSLATPLNAGKSVFYAVGGAWRAFARLHMELTGYPLRVLQSYSMSATDVVELSRRVVSEEPKVVEAIKTVAGKRAATLPFAAVVLERLMLVGNMSSLSVSAFGLREGLVYDSLPQVARSDDPLFAGMKALSGNVPAKVAFGDTLADSILPVLDCLPTVFESVEREQRLWRAACQLADIGATLHPDHRAEISRDLTIRGQFSGEDHVGRAFLASAVAHRYDRKRPIGPSEQKLLDDAQRSRAKALGLLMRVGAAFSGRSAELMKLMKMGVDGETLVFWIDYAHVALVSETVDRRLDQAAKVLDLEAELHFT